MARTRSTPDARPSVSGRVWRGTKAAIRAPFATFPAAAISESARLIGRLYDQVRSNVNEETRVRTYLTEDSRIDLMATGLMLGLGDDRLQERIDRRRRQAARLSYASLALGCSFVVLWVWRVLASEWSGSHLLGAVQFTPFVAIFFLVAFKYAHINWQLRTGTPGSASEYLRSPEPFLPR